MFLNSLWENLQSIGEQIGSFWPIMVAIFAAFEFSRRGVQYLLKAQNKALDENLAQRLAPLEFQLHTNGGTTLRDAVARIENNQSRVIDGFDSVGLALSELKMKVDLSTVSQEILSAKVRALIMGSDTIGYWSTNSEGTTTVEANKRYMEIWGFTDASQIGTDEWLQQLTPKSRELAEQRLEHIIKHPGEWNYTMDLLDGRVLRIHGWPIVINNRFDGYVGTLEEI